MSINHSTLQKTLVRIMSTSGGIDHHPSDATHLVAFACALPFWATTLGPWTATFTFNTALGYQTMVTELRQIGISPLWQFCRCSLQSDLKRKETYIMSNAHNLSLKLAQWSWYPMLSAATMFDVVFFCQKSSGRAKAEGRKYVIYMTYSKYMQRVITYSNYGRIIYIYINKHLTTFCCVL